ncbi:hypothetical protein M7I_5142 [Glarea lozoyensis 74030]|nr:hypothetical protein M7I_5142 [Glarea lozoyensis 74030]
MRVKRRLVYQLASEPEVVTWAMTSKVIRRGGFLIEKVKRTPAIFESLSRGNLAAHGPATAIRIVQAAIREGQTVLSGTITRIVEHCVAKQDYKAAIKLLDAILLGWDSDSVPTAITYTPDVRYALYRLLALCGVDSTNTDRGHTLHPRLNGVALQNLLRHVQLESLSNSITYAADQLHKASVALVGPNIAKNSVPCKTPPRDNYRAFSLAGVPTAVHILEGLSQTQKRQDRSIGKRVSDCRQIRLYGIEARLAVQALWVENASEHYELNIALYDKLSERSKREYIALCMVNSKTPSSTFSKLSTLSRLEAQDQAAKTRLQPRWHSVNGLQARTKEEVAFQKLMLKTA